MLAKLKEVILAVPAPEIIVCSNEVFVGQNVGRMLAEDGLEDVEVVNPNQLKLLLSFGFSAQLVLVDYNEDLDPWGGVATVKAIRQEGFEGMLALVTSGPSIEETVAAFRLGVNDILVRGKNLELAQEARDLLSRGYARPKGRFWNHEVISELGLFRTAGLSTGQVEILVEYAKKFGSHHEIAEALGKSEIQVRKVISRIYQRLGPLFGVRTASQLSHLLTVCIACVDGRGYDY